MRQSILIVDDDDSIRNNYKDILEDEGYLVFEYDSADSWNTILADSVFDIAILDISINGDRCAGHAMCNSLKSRFPSMPVIMLTSLDDEQNRAIAINNGADGYWIKSARLDDFLINVRSVLAKTG